MGSSTDRRPIGCSLVHLLQGSSMQRNHGGGFEKQVFDPPFHNYLVVTETRLDGERNRGSNWGWRTVSERIQSIYNVDSGGFQPGGLQRVTGGPISDALSCGTDNRMREIRRSDKSGSRTRRRHVAGRTAHVNVQTVEAQFAHHVRRLIEQLRVLSVQLRHDRTLGLMIVQRVQQKLWSAADVMHMGKLGEDHIRLPLPSHHESKARVRYSVHGRETDDRRRKPIPKRHGQDSVRYRLPALTSSYACRKALASRQAGMRSVGARSATNSTKRSIFTRKKSYGRSAGLDL